ncbi:Sec-independent protein translocase protein TatB [Qipengyuania huizhouensis]|jgi:sec-independent protein translocase protein TatB|uniref:Sec-independent protein translocase protein TatB n=1 Tax=Qipengyuania huizhouensis TaxID=2867245 RepID=UPI0017AFFD92|nr:Sec-independent protein translocase protein TatB [Qipengyuania huizhouensis]MBA4763985.1 twin-arginine translocase subunit TatB [Erythrobacter sp.]MBX7459428.1 Sec-independent protein translocase protein TatB [Qipengyuania huizhouensis]
MFDIGAAELLVIVVVAILVIGPKDMPKAMRTAGRWIGKLRRMSSHFRSGLDEMVRQAEIEEMEEKWSQRNKEIMAKYPTGSEPEGGAPENLLPSDEGMEPLASADEVVDPDAAAEAAIKRAAPKKAPERGGEVPSDEPGLPFGERDKDR